MNEWESTPKSCVTCHKVGPCGESLICKMNNHSKWVKRQLTEEQFREECKKNSWDGIFPLEKRVEPMIKLIKVTTQSGFRRYINADKINSITEIENGTSISTADHDGEFLVVEFIDEVLGKLGFFIERGKAIDIK